MSLAIPVVVSAFVALGLAATRTKAASAPAPKPGPGPIPIPPGPQPGPLPPIPPNPTPATLLELAKQAIEKAQAGEYIAPDQLEELASKLLIVNPVLSSTLYVLAQEMRKRQAPDIGGAGKTLPPALGARIAFLLSPNFAGTRAQFDAALAELAKLGGFGPLKAELENAKARLG